MSKRFKVGSGKVAIWDGHTNTDPFDNPLASSSVLNRVKFHSSLDYIRVVATLSATINLPARSNFQSATASHTVGAHGQSGQPFVLGMLPVNGVNVGFTGSIPVQMGQWNAGSTPGIYGRWLTLGADETNVIVYEYAVAQWVNSSSNGYYKYDAISVPVTVYITNELL